MGTPSTSGPTRAVLLSTSGGATFALAAVSGIPSGQAMVSFAGAKESGTTRFFCVTLGSADVYPGVTGADHANYQSVYTLDWGGSWVSRTAGIAAGDHPFFAGASRANVSVAYLAGGSDAGVPVVYRTADGGAHWSQVFLTTNNQNIATGWSGVGGARGWGYGEYALGFAVSPVDSNRAIITDLGFAHATSDGGATWHQAYVRPAYENAANSTIPLSKSYLSAGLENTTCWGLTWSDASNVFASFTDIRGVRSADGGSTWSFDYTGHTQNTMYRCVRHPVTGVLYAATSSVHDLYQSTYLQDSRIDGGAGLVLFSSDKGKTWQTLHNFGHVVCWVALDPTNANRLYASVAHSSAGGIYVSSNINLGASFHVDQGGRQPAANPGPPLHHRGSQRRDPRGGLLGAARLGRRLHGQLGPLREHQRRYDLDRPERRGHALLDQRPRGGPRRRLAEHLVRGGLQRLGRRAQRPRRPLQDHRPRGALEPHPHPRPRGVVHHQPRERLRDVRHHGGRGALDDLQPHRTTPAFSQVAGYPFQHPVRVLYDPYQAGRVWVTSFGYGICMGISGAVRAPEVSAAAASPLRAVKHGTLADITFEDAGATRYNLYVSKSPSGHPFRVLNAADRQEDLRPLGAPLLRRSPHPPERRPLGGDHGPRQRPLLPRLRGQRHRHREAPRPRRPGRGTRRGHRLRGLIPT